MMTALKIVLYARFSSLKQKTGSSLQRQLEDGRAYCQRMGWEIVEEITDEGRSAFHGHHRSMGNLGTFETDALSGQRTGLVLLCENLDRLSRGDPEAGYDFIRSLTKVGVSVCTFADEGFYEAGKPTDFIAIIKLLLTFQRANEESITKSDRSKKNWGIKKANALKDGTALSKRTHPWLTVVDGRYEVIEDRVAVVVRIFQEANAGDGALVITKMLNSNYKPWGKAMCWHRSFVIRLLSNRAVIGEHTINGEAVKLYPAIVAADVFERVRENAEPRKCASIGLASPKVNNLLAGLCRCDVCNGPMTFTGHFRLKCLKATNGACTNPASVAYKPLEQAVLDSCLHLALDDNAFTNRAEVSRLSGTIAERTSDLAAAKDKAKSLMNLYSTQQSKLAMTMALEAEQRADDLTANLKALKVQRENAKGRASNLEHMQRVSDMRTRLSSDVTLRKRVSQGFQSLITQVWFDVEGSAVLMLAGGLKALRIVDGVVVQTGGLAEAFEAGNVSRLHFDGNRDRKGAPSALKRILKAKATRAA